MLVAVAHVPLLVALATLRGYPIGHAVVDAAPVAILASIGWLPGLLRAARSCAVSAALIAASGALVHLSGGLIEMHFHFFVVVALLTLYQDWLPYLTAIGLTVLGHGMVALADPHAVYNHHHAVDHPWLWALIHGGFVLAASAANVACWRVSETDAQALNAEREAFYAERVQLLTEQAQRDPLTGLGNRRFLLDRLELALERSRRHGTRIAVLFIDLDGFKQVNDDYGHQTGDALLQHTAQLLSGRIRGEDTLARLGGDEFVVVCEDVTDTAAVETLVEDLRALIKSPMRVPDTRYRVSVSGSFGVRFSDGGSTATRLLEQADQRMYADKQCRRPATQASTGADLTNPQHGLPATVPAQREASAHRLPTSQLRGSD